MDLYYQLPRRSNMGADESDRHETTHIVYNITLSVRQ